MVNKYMTTFNNKIIGLGDLLKVIISTFKYFPKWVQIWRLSEIIAGNPDFNPCMNCLYRQMRLNEIFPFISRNSQEFKLKQLMLSAKIVEMSYGKMKHFS